MNITKIIYLPKEILIILVNHILRYKYLTIISYADSDRSNIMNLVYRIKKETKMIQCDNEAYQIFMIVKRLDKIQGDIAEIGVYKGGTSKLICEAKGEKSLYLFDTFDGIPKIDNIDKGKFYKGEFASNLENVKNYLKNYEKVFFYKGIFPDENANAIKNKKFSFVHLDADTYDSTMKCIQFFYPRMNKGGIILSHDYTNVSPGVKKAFDEFFNDKFEPIIEMSGSQCMIIKL